MDNYIRIRGARQHNLKNISLDIPKNKLVVMTGVSGSGKSSLAFDTIYAEGQRRYVESLSSYARQFLGFMDKPDVDSIEGLSPAISIDQKGSSHNPRSTVGTVTEIYDYLRLLFARVGHPHCPNCGREISKQSVSQIVDHIMNLPRAEGVHASKGLRFMILSPVVNDRKGEFNGLFDNLRAKGFRQVRVDGKIIDLNENIILLKNNKHSIDVVIDKLTIDKALLKAISSPSPNEVISSFRSRIHDSVEQATNLSNGLCLVAVINDPEFSMPDKPKNLTDHMYSERFACPVCNTSIAEIEPRTFSFNSPHGACPTCSGIGTLLTVDPALVINPILTISEGGILPFAKMFLHDTWFSRIVMTVVKAHEIDPRKPLSGLTEEQKHVLLYGTGDREYSVNGTNRQGEMTTIYERFEGIVGELVKRHSQTESDYVRMEIEKYMREELCPDCGGKRLKKDSLTITIDNKSIAQITDYAIDACLQWITSLSDTSTHILSDTESVIAKPIFREIIARLTFLVSVGLEYLTLSRTATTLAGGEAQRIRLASQIGSGLTGVLYVLDEPSIGLHQRDNHRLIETLVKLRDLGNSVIVVEHDRDMMMSSDWLIDIGPKAGKHGGNLVVDGTVSDVLNHPESITATYLTGAKIIERPKRIVENTTSGKTLTIIGAKHNNLKDVTVSFPLGKFICITGVSGSGKSTLIVETLYQALHTHFNPFSKEKPGAFDRIDGLENIDKVVLIDQSPIGRTPRSNPATYTGIFSFIRDLYAGLPESRNRGYRPGRFSFNVKGGRCETCEGEGQKKIEMQFLSDIYVTCEVCKGMRYNSETLEVHYRGKSIADVLTMTIEEARDFFIHIPHLHQKLEIIREVGLDYITLGQSAPTLSGGEAQRVKLASELSKRSTGSTVYILDEPTTGLHFADLEKLLLVLHQLIEKGNTVIVIEHNIDIIKNADWIIDLGPEGGNNGGEIVVAGSVQDIKKCAASHTGKFLR